MVEMLGVLAIIGVLSAGALAGYSKAMFMYKLNQFTEASNQLLLDCQRLSLQIDKTQSFNYSVALKALNMVPDGFVYNGSKTLKDNFYNSVTPTYTPEAGHNIVFQFSSANGGQAICRQLYIITKENSMDITRAFADNGNTVQRGEDYKSFDKFYGDSYCGESNRPCLKQMTMGNITNICKQCDYAHCRFYFHWD